jgi:hypothetical protein
MTMHVTDYDSSIATRRKKQLIIAAAASCGAVASLLALASGAYSNRVGGTVGSAVIGSLAFNAVATVARFSFTHVRKRVFLVGGFPMALGFARLSGFATVVFLLLVCAAGYVVGEPFRGIALRGLVFGALGFTIISFLADGLLNATIVLRHFRGTLAATSRETAREVR